LTFTLMLTRSVSCLNFFLSSVNVKTETSYSLPGADPALWILSTLYVHIFARKIIE